MVGFALAGGGTNYGVADGLGGGHSDMFQAAVYSFTRVNAAYLSAALAYGWQHVSTDRSVTVAGTDHLAADFSANDVGGRIEGGYRFAIPGVFSLPGFGITPYGALQGQAFITPSYNETAASGASTFALAYNAQTTTTTRTELGAWFDGTIALDNGATLTLRTRAAWAHDYWSASNMTAVFESLPGSSFTVSRRCARHRFLARLGRRGDQFQEWDLARRRVRQPVIPGLADLQRFRTAALYVVICLATRQAAGASRMMRALVERVEHTLIWTGMKAREELSVYSHCLPVTSPAPVPMSLVGLGRVETPGRLAYGTRVW